MKNVFIAIALLSIASQAIAQQKTYFQQDVAYKINVRLDDDVHQLHADYRLEYKNNSGQSLTEIKMHLWPNAYKDVTTAFAAQKDRTGDLAFRFSKPQEKGYIDSLAFKVDGKEAELEYDKKSPDMATLKLPKPLASGATCIITTPFHVQLPYTFSRGGHIDQAYQITQWYPKPAVFDAEGWHLMPYLDQGEFYSEYGTFDVSITIPKNYIIAATGTLQNAEEQAFLDDLAAKRNAAQDSFPESDKKLKTIRFTAEKVHDFGWFADKRFAVRKGGVALNNGKKVETWAFFPKEEEKIWEKATEFIGRAVGFYSEKVGDYPYPKACAVRGALKAGGGMEYPMVTVIAATGSEKTLDNVIMHEVGHNWFYGILGSNEREHPWMDEGLNSYIESRYMDSYYKQHRDMDLSMFGNGKKLAQEDLVYLLQGRQRIDQSCDTHSDNFSSSINYYLGAYGKPTMIFRYLEQYLGTTVMDKALHDYFTEWQFKHPQPADIKASFERSTGKDLSWFFTDMIATNKKIDYALTGMTSDGKLKVANRSTVKAPFCISAIKDNKVTGTEWYEGVEGSQEIATKGTIATTADRFVINEDSQFPEINQHNNTVRTSGALPTLAPLKLKFGAAWDDPKHTSIFLAPAIAWNNYDKTMLGLAVYSNLLPAKFDFSLAPMYSFGSKQLSGVADMNYRFYTENEKSFVRSVAIGASAKMFSQNYIQKTKEFLRYTAITPQVEIDFTTGATSNATSTLTLRDHLISTQDGNYTYNVTDSSFNYLTAKKNIQDIAYEYKKAGKYNPFSLKIQAQSSFDVKDGFGQSQSFVRASVEANYRITYKKNGQGLDIRLFVGSMLYDEDAIRNRKASIYGSFNPYGYGIASFGGNDIAYDQYFFGRNDAEGIWSQQNGSGMGGFKLPASNQAGFGGNTAGSIAALNLSAALPFKLPIKPYFDVAYVQVTTPSLLVQNPRSPRAGLPIIDKDAKIDNEADQLFYQGGLQLNISDILKINFPLINSNQLETYYNGRPQGYFQRVTFSLDLLKLAPRKVLKGLLNTM